MATHPVEVDEIQTTRGEKALAVVLALFLLLGLVWGYTRLDLRHVRPVVLTPSEQAAIARHDAAQRALSEAQTARAEALLQVELTRERYRTALEAGQPASALERRYRAAERALARAEGRLRAARAREASLRTAANAAHARAFERAEEERRRDARLTFLFRLVYTVVVLGAAYGLFTLLRGSRYLTLGIAAVASAALLALVFAGDYVEDRVEWRSTGPFAVSAAGVALTVASFWGLQRYLRRRLPLRRVRRRECPFCGFPVAGNVRCEGCGREVVGRCTRCGEPRRVGVRFCGSCGQA